MPPAKFKDAANMPASDDFEDDTKMPASKAEDDANIPDSKIEDDATEPPALENKDTYVAAASITTGAAREASSILADPSRVNRFTGKVASVTAGPDVISDDGPPTKPGAFVIRGMASDFVEDDEEAPSASVRAIPSTRVLDMVIEAEVVPEDAEGGLQANGDASGIENAEDVNVVVEEEVESKKKSALSKWARHGMYGICALVVVAVTIVLGATLGGSGGDGGSDDRNITNTDANGKTGNSLDNCFIGRYQLIQAVDNYLIDKSTTAEVYGWPIGTWCVNRVKSFETLFSAERTNRASSFNEPLDGWVLASAERLDRMFEGAAAFNQDLSMWTVSRVTTLHGMFNGATSFNGNVASWSTSSVTNMSSTFAEATSFNQNLATWDISKVTDFTKMFSGARAYNHDLCSWGDTINRNARVFDTFIGTGCAENNTATDLGATPPGPLCSVCLE